MNREEYWQGRAERAEAKLADLWRKLRRLEAAAHEAATRVAEERCSGD